MSGESIVLAEANTWVFWDLEDCPIPKGLNPDSIYKNIKSALKNKGYRGAVSIKAYGEKKKTFSDDLLNKYMDAGITLFQVPAGGKDARVNNMLWDILLWAVDSPKGSNLMVILNLSEDTESEFVNALENMKTRGYNVILAQPDEQIASESILRSVSSVWLSTSLLDEGELVDLTGICVNNFDDFNSAKDMEVMGTLRLKIELQLRGLKCGGTLQERAARLFLLKSTPLDKLPTKLLAKKKK